MPDYYLSPPADDRLSFRLIERHSDELQLDDQSSSFVPCSLCENYILLRDFRIVRGSPSSSLVARLSPEAIVVGDAHSTKAEWLSDVEYKEVFTSPCGLTSKAESKGYGRLSLASATYFQF